MQNSDSTQTLELLNMVAKLAIDFAKDFGKDSDFCQLGFARFVKRFELDVVAEGTATAEETMEFFKRFREVVQSCPPSVPDTIVDAESSKTGE